MLVTSTAYEAAEMLGSILDPASVESRLAKEGDTDPAGALGAVRLGTSADAILVGPGDAAGTAIGLSKADLPADLVAATEEGQPSSQIYRADGSLLMAVSDLDR